MKGEIRVMHSSDLDEVFQIEEAAYDFPWTRGIFDDCLRVGYPALVYEDNSIIQGYGLMSVAVGEGHILNICIKPEAQGQGIGGLVLESLIDSAMTMDVNTLFLEVRASNSSAISLYRKNGFNEIGLRKNYYPAFEGREDAVLLARHLGGDMRGV